MSQGASDNNNNKNTRSVHDIIIVMDWAKTTKLNAV